MVEVIAWFVACILVIAAVTLHYEVMSFTSDRLIPWAQRRLYNRRVMVFTIGCLMVGHIAQIWLFALVTMIGVQDASLGAVQGDFTNHWGDFLYLSAVNYTSLGDGGLRLVGPARVLAATETLVGMMMIAWSASFTYLKMETIWRKKS